MPTLFQKFVRLASQCLGNADQTGQRKIILGTFDATDKRPVHVGAFGERFLRQRHFFSESPHVLCHPLAILDVHAGKVWKKRGRQNIDVTAIEYNTSTPLRKNFRILLASGRDLRENRREFQPAEDFLKEKPI